MLIWLRRKSRFPPKSLYKIDHWTSRFLRASKICSVRSPLVSALFCCWGSNPKTYFLSIKSTSKSTATYQSNELERELEQERESEREREREREREKERVSE